MTFVMKGGVTKDAEILEEYMRFVALDLYKLILAIMSLEKSTAESS